MCTANWSSKSTKYFDMVTNISLKKVIRSVFLEWVTYVLEPVVKVYMQ